MRIPVQISFRDMTPSDAVRAACEEAAAKLERIEPDITRCRITVAYPHKHQHKGRLFSVHVDLTLPGRREAVVSHDPHDKHAHEDVYVAIRDAFRAAEQQLRSLSSSQKGRPRQAAAEPQGRITRLFPTEGYGFITSADGPDVYFHRNALQEGNFDDLTEGLQVAFGEASGQDGPQATFVRIID